MALTRQPLSVTRQPGFITRQPNAVTEQPSIVTNQPEGFFAPHIITGASFIQYVQGDLGVQLNGSTVATWLDQSGSAKNYSQAVAGKQPAFNATELNGKPVLTFDGVDDELTSTLTRPAPGTTPTFGWAIAQLTATNAAANAKPFSGSTNYAVYIPTGGTTAPSFYDGVIVASGFSPTVATWYRWEWYFSNSASDYLQIGALRKAGTAAGNLTEAAGMNIASGGGVNFCKLKVAAMGYANALPNERCAAAGGTGALDAAALAWFGSSVNF